MGMRNCRGGSSGIRPYHGFVTYGVQYTNILKPLLIEPAIGFRSGEKGDGSRHYLHTPAMANVVPVRHLWRGETLLDIGHCFATDLDLI